MSHKTLIGGTAHEVTGGKVLIGGTAHDIASGKTLVGGTGYDIGFGVEPLTIYDGGSALVNGSLHVYYAYWQGTTTSSGVNYGYTSDTYNVSSFSIGSGNGCISLMHGSSQFGGTVPTFANIWPYIGISGIDVTRYSTLYVTAKTSQSGCGRLGLSTSMSNSSHEVWSSMVRSSASTFETYSVDISSYTGSGYYIKIGDFSQMSCQVYISKIWLE